MNFQFVCVRNKQLARKKKALSSPYLTKEDIIKLKESKTKSMPNAELCAACKLTISTFYNTEQQVNMVSCPRSCHLKYLMRDALQVDNFNLMVQEPFKLPDKSIYYHFNNELLYPNAKNQYDYSAKNVLLIGCGGIKRLSVLKSLLQLKFKKFVCLHKERSWAHDYLDDWIYAENEDVNRKEEALKAIQDYCQTNNIKFDAIFTYDDFCVLTTSYIQQEMKLPGIPFEFLGKIKNKYEFRNECQRLSISCPKYFLIKNEEFDKYSNLYKSKTDLNKGDAQSKEFITELTDSHKPVRIEFPLIIKNIYGVGKDFVKKCYSIKDFCESLNYIQSSQLKIDIIVEEFFDGHEIDLDILIQDNKMKFVAISDNLPPLEPWFYEQGGILPSIYLTSTEKKAIVTLLARWISKMNFQNAVLHFEARCRPSCLYQSNLTSVLVPDVNNNMHIDEEAYYKFLIENENYFLMPIEINPRLGGAEIWSTVITAFNVNMINEYANICLGFKLDEKELINKQNNPRNQCISKDFHPAIDCKVNSIQINLDQLKRNPNAVEICIFRSPGETLSYKDYLGFVTVLCNPYDPSTSFADLDLLMNKRDKIIDLINFDLHKI